MFQIENKVKLCEVETRTGKDARCFLLPIKSAHPFHFGFRTSLPRFKWLHQHTTQYGGFSIILCDLSHNSYTCNCIIDSVLVSRLRFWRGNLVHCAQLVWWLPLERCLPSSAGLWLERKDGVMKAPFPTTGIWLTVSRGNPYAWLYDLNYFFKLVLRNK